MPALREHVKTERKDSFDIMIEREGHYEYRRKAFYEGI